ncbi:M23 family metallopeptidase [Dysgonomonas sp. HDW5A]|uniref:M23 family metallopeptidase n=1 Tax=Dysgonomonas sp. HDW5A TaxID=2714926 RepID=UPI001409115F|nr:M23 family metallopeptidase [Dysgonomonas sp. HDW5A]QIK58884.1 M23 family metallopeptidase [Dysgonomonas sp. HDW5A]
MNKIIVIISLLLSFHTSAQEYRSPLDIPLLLSANFGELRNNHFHSGIDIKTQGVEGKPVYSIADGYISRIGVSPSGYGLVLYIDHPNGQTSVYGHLSSYNVRISEYVKQEQYKQESFRIDVKLSPYQIPVKKGDLVAYTGNTGGSGGPHLHFEIRETKTEKALDPLVYYKKIIADNKSPEVKGIAAYPVPGRGVINGTILPLHQSVTQLKAGGYSPLKQSIEAWGLIGLGIKAYDRMDATSNIYGVRVVSLSVDNKEVFRSEVAGFPFDQSRMINTFTEFADWRLNKSFYMQSFIEPGNKLPFYSSINSGYININEERPYQISYELEDLYGNKSVYDFTVIGKKQNIITPSACNQVLIWDKDNKYNTDQFTLSIPKGNLYNDVCFTLSQASSTEYYSDIYSVNKTPVPLDKSGEVSIKLSSDPLSNKKQYGVVQLTNNRASWIGGSYKNGSIIAKIRELGIRLAVSADTEAPKITRIETSGKGKRRIVVPKDEIRIRMSDNLSGIATFKGTIDGKFALFTHDMKSSIYTYKFDPARFKKGITHKIVFTATDGCGNTAQYTGEFFY